MTGDIAESSQGSQLSTSQLPSDPIQDAIADEIINQVTRRMAPYQDLFTDIRRARNDLAEFASDFSRSVRDLKARVEVIQKDFVKQRDRNVEVVSKYVARINALQEELAKQK